MHVLMSLSCTCSGKCIFPSKIGQALWTWLAEFNCESPFKHLLLGCEWSTAQSHLWASSNCVRWERPSCCSVFYQQSLGRRVVWPQNKRRGNETVFPYFFSNILNGTWLKKGGTLGLAFYTREHILSGYPEACFFAGSLHTGAKFRIRCQLSKILRGAQLVIAFSDKAERLRCW